MTDRAHAGGVMAMLVERFESQHLNRLLQLKQAMEAGDRLSDHHSNYLARALGEARLSKHIVDRHPEYHRLYTRIIGLYGDITRRALENEMNAGAAASGAIP
jgi:hypothetical protein